MTHTQRIERCRPAAQIIIQLILAISAVTSSALATATPLGSCNKHVVITGYWPPTNEMLRPWSTDPALNPTGWIGANWGDYGFDVHAFFPEFPPDGNPMNDPFGSDGWIGSPASDLRVDFQDTSADFWRIMDDYQPSILITTSRGGQIDWELEAIEGGHQGPKPDPARDWRADEHGADTYPTQASIDPRSWHAISTYRAGQTLDSQLPLAQIAAATRALNLGNVDIDRPGTSGNYLSGFMGLHGLYYHQLAPHSVAAGHIHVGTMLPVDSARALMEATLHAVLSEFDAQQLPCPN